MATSTYHPNDTNSTGWKIGEGTDLVKPPSALVADQETEYTSTEKNNASTDDSNQVGKGFTTYPGHKIRFAIDEAPANITQLDIILKTQFYGPASSGSDCDLFIFNHASATWGSRIDFGTGAMASGDTLSATLTTELTNYVDESGYIYICLHTNTASSKMALDLYFTELTVTYAEAEESSSNPPSSEPESSSEPPSSEPESSGDSPSSGEPDPPSSDPDQPESSSSSDPVSSVAESSSEEPANSSSSDQAESSSDPESESSCNSVKPSITQAIISYLLADCLVSDLVGTRIVPTGSKPQAFAFPHIDLHRVSNEHWHSRSGPAGHAQAILEINCWADSNYSAHQIYDAVCQALHSVTGVAAGVAFVSWIINDAEMSERRNDGSDDYIHRVEIDLEIIYTE